MSKSPVSPYTGTLLFLEIESIKLTNLDMVIQC